MLSRVDVVLLLLSLQELPSIVPGEWGFPSSISRPLGHQHFIQLFPEVPASTWRVTTQRLMQEQAILPREIAKKRCFLLTHHGRERVKQFFATTALTELGERWSLLLLRPWDEKPRWQAAKGELIKRGWYPLSRGEAWVWPQWVTSSELESVLRSYGLAFTIVPVRPDETWPEPWARSGVLAASTESTWRKISKLGAQADELLEAFQAEKVRSKKHNAQIGTVVLSGLSYCLATSWIDSLDMERRPQVFRLVEGLRDLLREYLQE